MIKRKYEKKEHVVREDVLVEEKRFCDMCGKEITDHHWEVTTGHRDWGNDSCDSIEDHDVCSSECLMKLFEEYSKESNDKHNSMYFEVEHTNWSGVKGVVKEK